MKRIARCCLVLSLWSCLGVSQAALFEDDEARRAILELRQSQRALQERLDRQGQEVKALSEDNGQLRRALLDFQAQIEALRAELSGMRGDKEVLLKDLADTQRRLKDQAQVVEERFRKFEPLTVSLDGIEFQADPAEKREFDNALAVFRRGEFTPAANAFADFIRRYPQSGYLPQSLFWLGNAQYATREYKLAITNFRSLLSVAAQHPRAAEALLSIANCQVELKDTKAARKTLEDLVKDFPQSEAAAAAKERLSRLK
ncbi:MAG: tol-pal system protein YbgF [Limnohabitans sp.]|jgi:tol-pal system protein YbgF|nr:tol-pal system protein YbgF [Limnohabitans sp.]